jgi:cytochrome c-type biogenesis protein
VRDVAAGLLVAFGLSMVWPQVFQRLSMAGSGLLNRFSSLGDRAGSGWTGGVLVGVSLGAIWTPCAGPVLATILTLVSAQQSWAASASLLALYALGAALPMLGIAYGGQWAMAKVRAFSGHTHRLQQALGLVVAAVGLLTLLQCDTLVTLWLSDFYPSLSGGL